MSKGLFIAFEGIDASGKQTQAELTAEHLSAKLYSFPDYRTPTGRAIKAWLNKDWKAVEYRRHYEIIPEEAPPVDALAFQALMTVNRLEKALPITWALNGGINVVADRYWPSGYVYGSSDGLDETYLKMVHEFLPQPDLIFLLDISAAESFKRRPDRGGDRYEESRAKMEDVVERYRNLFDDRHRHNLTGSHWVTLDGTKSPEEIHQQVLTRIQQLP